MKQTFVLDTHWAVPQHYACSFYLVRRDQWIIYCPLCKREIICFGGYSSALQEMTYHR